MAIAKAKINIVGENNKSIEVMFNPPSLKIASFNQYTDPKSTSVDKTSISPPQFIRTNPDILTVDLFFDTTREKTSVSEKVNPILALAKSPGEETKKTNKTVNGKVEIEESTVNKKPPKLTFAWGGFLFPCIIESIDQTYDYFDSQGQALRAMLSIKFRRCELDEQPQQDPVTTPAKKQAEKPTKKETVKAGDNLQTFCSDEKNWRPTAEINNIDNPNVFYTGMMRGMLIKRFLGGK